MGDISAHLSKSEIRCKCGCGYADLKKPAIELFEAVRHELGDKPLIVTSGCRCSKHSVAVGGYSNDMHTRGLALDVRSDYYTPEQICAAAEKCGANGIGLMKSKGAAHFDAGDRVKPWRGNEDTGENVATFITAKNVITVCYNGKEIFRKEV